MEFSMTPEQLKEGRKAVGLTQSDAAAKLGVTQGYVSLLEGAHRPVPRKLAKRVVSVYHLPATALPLTQNVTVRSVSAQELAEELAALGYPGFAYLRSRKKRNPAEVLMTALAQQDLESRLVEALPWVLFRFPDLDWDWVMKVAKQNDLQNRLGFVTTLARQVAEKSVNTEHWKVNLLSEREAALDRVRLAREDTLCKASLTDAERSWLKKRRPAEAAHWNLLTDLAPEHLAHVTAT